MAVKQRLDTPTNNFATLNPLFRDGTVVISHNGNLTYTAIGGDSATYGDNIIGITQNIPTFGKWYFEVYCASLNSGTGKFGEFGLGDTERSNFLVSGYDNSWLGHSSTNPSDSKNIFLMPYYATGSSTQNGHIRHGSWDGGASNSLVNNIGWVDGAIAGLFVDCDNNEVTWSINGSNIANATKIAVQDLSNGSYSILLSFWNSASSTTYHLNFGQNPSFHDAITPTKVYTDARGLGRFYHQPPEGALALCTANLGSISYISAPTSYISDETNTKTLTYNGNVEQVPYSPYATDGYSMYFDGGSLTYLRLDDYNHLITPKNSDFTIETWIYITGSSSAKRMILYIAGDPSTGAGVEFEIDAIGANTDKLSWMGSQTASPNVTSNSSIPHNKWNHIAVVKKGSYGYILINGVVDLKWSDTTNYTSPASVGARIGTNGSGQIKFNGYLSDFRILEGNTAYITTEVNVGATYTVPTSPISSGVSGCKFLLSSLSTVIKDTSGITDFTKTSATAAYTVQLQQWSPYTSDAIEFGAEYRTPENAHKIGSFSFDGTNDFIELSDTSDYAFGADDDFLIECWVYPKTSGSARLICHSSFQLAIGSTNYISFSNKDETAILASSHASGLFGLHQWYHIVVTRNGSSTSRAVKIFVNGVLAAIGNSVSTITTANFADNTASRIGTLDDGTKDFNGYITDFRIIKGSFTVYNNSNTTIGTSAFTPSADKLSSAVANTKILLQPYKSYNAANLLTSNFSYNKDSSPIPKSLTYAGVAKVVDVSPYKSGANGSFGFIGSSTSNRSTIQSLTIYDDLVIGTGQFTIETWVNLSVTAAQSIFDTQYSSDLGLQIFTTSANLLKVYIRNGGDLFTSTITLDVDRWYHIALTRDGSNDIRLYVNGIFDKEYTSGTYTTSNYNWNGFALGSNYYGAGGSGSEYLNGFITDLRIIKGKAIYTGTGAFTPPAFPLRTDKYTIDGTDPASGTAFGSSEIVAFLGQPGALASNDPAKKPFEHFKCVTWTGSNNNVNVDFVNFTPDLLWAKNRYDSASTAISHSLIDTVRGDTKLLASDSADAQTTVANLSTFNSNNTVTLLGGYSRVNDGNNSRTYVGWGWAAGGSTPSKTYYVKVVDDSGNKYRFIGDVTNSGAGDNHPALSLQKGGTYTFDQSDSTNSSHPLLFYTNNSRASTTLAGVTVTSSGTPGTAGAYTRVVIASDASTNAMSYQCSSHPNMGGSGTSTNTTLTTTHGQTEFGGSIIPIVSANKEAGFSIVKYTGNGVLAATVPHGLSGNLDFIITKDINAGSDYWHADHISLPSNGNLFPNNNQDTYTNSADGWVKGTKQENVIEFGTSGSTVNAVNEINIDVICYCWKAIPGYSAFGSYEGTNNAIGPFVYTGFRPSWILFKRTDSDVQWEIYDSARDPHNPYGKVLQPDSSADEDDVSASYPADMLSNGFKIRHNGGAVNGSGSYIYIAFAEAPVNFSNAR